MNSKGLSSDSCIYTTCVNVKTEQIETNLKLGIFNESI